ncbi:MAG: malectin domain-containing carbohydrate-binding protein [Pirellulales bacterium]
MSSSRACLIGVCLITGFLPAAIFAQDAKLSPKYFAHAAVEDGNGVIAPWYRGLNGQCDFRIRVAAETLKRYPWADKDAAVMAAPHFIFNGHWSIKPDGTILPSPNLSDWDNADIGQRSASLLFGLTGYYRYTGDAAAIGLVTLTADHLLDYCQTPADHPWPSFPISAPTQGKPYGRANPRGFIQLDLSAQLGSGMILAYKLTGNPRYLEAVKHWADLLAAHCDHGEGRPPWNRYANPEDVKWGTRETAGVSLILQFLNETIRLGYQGKDGALVKARDAGERYLRDALLPEWSRDRTFGHHFWDWEQAVYGCGPVWYTADYMMNRREAFPNWQSDLRNVLSMYFCRTSVDPASKSGTFSGAWAFPESSGCCGDSLQYSTMSLAAPLARYGVLADSPWAREVARRQTILSTYDAHETGVVEDGVGGGVVVTGAWYNLAHPWPLRCVLEMLAWQPQLLGANRENHVVRTSSVVRAIRYGKGQIAYSTFDGASPCEDVLRLAFSPKRVLADGGTLQLKAKLFENGYSVEPIANGDTIVTIRHDGCREIVVEGDDPQQTAEDDQLQYTGPWSVEPCAEASGGNLHVASEAGAETSFTFEGNQVRLIGRVGPRGGKADVYLDGVKQLCGIDCWCPETRYQQVLYYKNGLAQGKHALRVALLGVKNPVAQGTRLCIDAVQWSATQGEAGFGEGRGPTELQRVIFGYLGRKDYVDSQGGVWRPATEFVLRLTSNADLVPVSFWSEPRVKDVAGTADPEPYRYGVHGRDFTAYFTVAPAGSYQVRLKFCQAEKPAQPGQDATSIELQGKEVVSDMDVAAKAGGLGKAVDLVYDDVRPVHGMIAIRFWNRRSGTAMIQAIEIVPRVAKTDISG